MFLSGQDLVQSLKKIIKILNWKRRVVIFWKFWKSSNGTTTPQVALIYGFIIKANNLLNQSYEIPHGFTGENRQFTLGYNKKF